MASASVEKQIGTYLSSLSAAEKKTVLSVVKTIVLAKQEYEDIWSDEDFAKEMDRRTAEYEKGTAKLYKFGDIKEAAIANYKAKRKSRK